ncbi:glyoxalase [Aeromicrobium sp.]|uniref:glyoxalase n=1 Tax=Aeromicrobium sp. TaxID=1871063 RepID=UPI002FC7DCBB
MTNINHITLEVTDTTAAKAFYAAAFDVDKQIELRQASDEPSEGFRGYTLSLVVAQPSTVDSLFSSALEAGATEIKPVTKSFWGYGGSLRAPDGTIWKIASSSKKETGPATRQIDDVVLLLGVDDVKATKQFYADQGLKVGRSFGSKYVEFETTNVKLALYGHKALAKDAGVPVGGTGSHRIAISSDAGTFTDLDGFGWE